MSISQALEKLTDAIRLRHLAASTEEAYRWWLQSDMQRRDRGQSLLLSHLSTAVETRNHA